ncbi:uncharacterized protein [Physcomitrium patens]|uniref:uncharacterized protein isoform X2 n=1 Tax=Physcomitrium patens TaxID=3218 RepID=UPI000D166BE2|nr:UPF0769 protein C21orf59 homolog isoform X2 [Physcomitrium patens]|eukprot:XP_024372008.1 UPF0769 protein C21orf59 homolog isoform X2 [Physcomitrella patens]
MVLLHVKQKDDRQFLFEASAKASVDSVVRELVVVNNLQVRILGLQEEVKWLALYGPAKHPDDDEDSDDESQNGKKIRGPHYSKDPHCRRTGEACDPEVSKQITNTMADAVALVSKENVMAKNYVTSQMLKDQLNLIRGAITICYPQGLPKWDVVQQAISGTSSLKETLDPDTTRLWWAGKEILRDKCLKDYVGQNEKTKIIVKLRAQGSGCPEREPLHHCSQLTQIRTRQ